MFTVEVIKSASETSTSINLESRRECENIMKRIYDENPKYWPHGLDMGSHDGGVYMIREASTNKPIGFTGWQERKEGNTKVGFYSIGILPEYRHNGYAKKAVAALINLKSANVDTVRAFVMKDNKPSLALADSLHIDIIKAGSEKKADESGALLKMLASGIGSAGFMDSYTYGRDKNMQQYMDTPFTAGRGAQALANVIFGAVAGKPGLSAGERLAALGAIPAKDVAVSAIPAIPSITSSLKDIASRPNPPAPPNNFIDSLSPTQKMVGGGLGLAGLLGAGYLGSKAVRALNGVADAEDRNAAGKIHVNLPSKEPGGAHTTVEMPLGNMGVSNSQIGKIQRDLRRTLRKETKDRTFQRSMGHLIDPIEAPGTKTSFHKINNLLNIL